MKIIIDECVPSIVKRGLPSLAIVSVQDMGWAGIKNGRLLTLIAAEFDLFITSDKNLRYQQNLSAFKIAVILLPSNQVPVVKAMLPEIENAISGLGDERFVEL
jgi:hypothetical protein